MKKLYALMVSGIMVTSSLTAVSHASDNIIVTLNGSNIYFDQPPIIENGRTLVPMRAIFEAMGCEVEWDGDAQMIDVWKDEYNVMTLWIDDNEMWTPEGNIYLEVAPKIVNSRTLVPVRAISESMGATVGWNNTTRTVTISYSNGNSSNSIASSCKHVNTHEVCWIDLRKFEQTGSDVYHNAIDTYSLVCDDCGEDIDSNIKKSHTQEHFFENGVCRACGYEQEIQIPKSTAVSTATPTQMPIKNVSSGDLNVYDDGNFKTVTVSPGESFMAKNTTASSFKINIQDSEYAKRVDYVIYKDDGNVLKTEYNRAINLYGKIEIKSGYSIGIYNPNDYEITVKGPSDAFYPEDRDAFDIININEKSGIEVFNDTQTSYDVFVIGDEYDAKRFDYVVYKDDGNVLTSAYDRAINLYGKIEIKAGYSVGVYNSNTDSIIIMVPSDVFNYSYSNVFDIKKLNPGQSCSVSNNTKTKFEISVRSETGAKKFDYVTYNDKGETITTEYGRAINLYGHRELKPGYSISISNSSDDAIMVYIPKNVN